MATIFSYDLEHISVNLSVPQVSQLEIEAKIRISWRAAPRHHWSDCKILEQDAEHYHCLMVVRIYMEKNA